MPRLETDDFPGWIVLHDRDHTGRRRAHYVQTAHIAMVYDAPDGGGVVAFAGEKSSLQVVETGEQIWAMIRDNAAR